MPRKPNGAPPQRLASLETLEMPTPKKKGKGKGKAGAPTRGGRTPVSMPTRTTTRGAKGKKVGGGAVGGKKKKKKAEAPPPPDPEKVAAAIAVQRAYRGHLVLKRAAEARAAEKRRREQQEELDRLEQEAYVEMMKVNQAAEAKRMAKVAEQRRKMQEKAKYEAELREAAFDNEVDDMVELLGMDLVEVDAKDPNGDTPFLEAAGGGSVDALNLLAERGATVNARGKFMRTPLFRAAFGGHHKAVIRLLELGCDPRLHDAEGVLPADVSANAKCKDHINKWDLDETDRIALLFDEKRAAAEAIRAAQLQKESEVVASDLEMAEKDYKARQRELAKAYQEFEKRLTEYDTVMHTPEEKKPQVVVDAVLVAVKEGEKHLANMKIAADEATMKYQAAKLKVREHEHKEMEEAGTLPQHERCSLRELDDVVLKDVGEKLSNDDRWPLLIDLSKQAATFFRYRDVNYVSAASPKDTEADALRLALLGAIRYGKPLVVDLLDVDLWQTFGDRIEGIAEGLFEQVVTKQILEPAVYEALIKEEDGDEYNVCFFTDERMANFKIVFVTTLRFPDPEMLDQCHTIEVVPRPAGAGGGCGGDEYF